MKPIVFPKPMSISDEMKLKKLIAEREPKHSAYLVWSERDYVKVITPVLTEVTEALNA